MSGTSAQRRARVSALLIDDDEDDYVALRDLIPELPNLALELNWISDPDAGLAELERQQHDVYLVDYRLGSRNGVDLLRAASDAGCSKPMIMMTSVKDVRLEEAAIHAGATDYLIKGRATADLVDAAIRHALDRATVLLRLRKSEERYALALRGANDGIWDWDLERDQIHLSARWKEMLGYSDREIGTRPGEWLDRVHPEDLPELRERLDAHLRGESAHFELESRCLHRDGSYRWMLARGCAVRDVTGTATRMAGSQSDVTERRLAQENLLSHVSHELRTPLAAIYQFASLVHDGLAGAVSDEQRELLGSALRNCRQLQKMIGDMMEAVRAASGKLAIEPTRLATRELIEEAMRTLRAAAHDRGIELCADLPGALPDVFADADRLRQILINLVDNACKFTPESGRVCVSARIDPGEADRVRFCVTDTGCGIDPTALERIFERMHQEEAGQKSRRGIGLGLYLCRELVQRQGGRIWAESVPGKGSSFFFTLPAASTARALVPVVLEHARTGRPIAAISMRIDGPTPSSDALRKIHHLLLEMTRKGGEVILPGEAHGGNAAEFLLVTCAEPARAQAISARIAEALGPYLDAAAPGLRARVAAHPCELTPGDERIDALAGRLHDFLRSTFHIRRTNATEERT